MKESDGCGEDHKKKKMGEGGYITNRHVDRMQTRNPSRRNTNLDSPSRPQRTHEDRACRVRVNLQFGVWDLYLPVFNGFHATARFRTLFAGVLMVYGESGKLDDNGVTPRF